MSVLHQDRLFADNFTFWAHLSPSEQQLVRENSQITTYPAYQQIHSSESECLGVVLVLSGQLRSYMLSEGGRDITLYRVYPGDICILSAACALSNITFEVTVDAEEESELLIINPAAFQKLVETNIYVECFSYQQSTMRFSDFVWAMQQILFMSFDKRLAIFLLDESSKLGSLQLKLTHEQIAKYMGSAREVVTRMLKYFSEEKIVKLARGQIQILDKQKLRDMVK